MSTGQTRYYRSFSDDFVTAPDQNYALPKSYQWQPNRFLSAIVYGFAIAVGYVYLHLFFKIRYINRDVLKQTDGKGSFIYINHTQPFGDVFLPALPVLPERICTVVSPANLSLPVIGRILPFLGALPIPGDISGMRNFLDALRLRLEEGRSIAIFPEAHVWPYYTGIRPFPATSFHYPVKFSRPVYCMTVTYHKRRFFKRPGITVYIDGPFFPDEHLSPKKQAAKLHDAVYCCMKRRSENSSYDYITYLPAERDPKCDTPANNNNKSL